MGHSGHGGGRGSMRQCRRHVEYRNLLLVRRVDGERAGLVANLGTGRLKNKIREDVWALHDNGHGRQPSSYWKAGK